MKETLLDRAFSNYKAFEINFSHKTDDEFFLNLSGYLLQQSTELSIKHLLEVAGIRYPKTHDIMSLINLVPDNKLYLVDGIKLYADVLTTWESKSRYIKNYFLEVDSINTIYPLVKSLLMSIRKDEDSNEKTDIKTIASKYIDERYIEQFISILPKTAEDEEEIKQLADMFMKMKGIN